MWMGVHLRSYHHCPWPKHHNRQYMIKPLCVCVCLWPRWCEVTGAGRHRKVGQEGVGDGVGGWGRLKGVNEDKWIWLSATIDLLLPLRCTGPIFVCVPTPTPILSFSSPSIAPPRPQPVLKHSHYHFKPSESLFAPPHPTPPTVIWSFCWEKLLRSALWVDF